MLSNNVPNTFSVEESDFLHFSGRSGTKDQRALGAFL